MIDLLNQGKQLDEWSQFPDGSEEEANFVQALKRTVGRVHSIRKAFKGFAEAYTRRSEGHPLRAQLTEEQKAESRRLLDFEFNCQSFSDTIVLYSPLTIPGGDTTVYGVYGMLFGSASVLLMALAEGVPLRGGIEVGMAIDYFPDEVYGPALRRAYLLEQHVAQYPRIVVGRETVAYLRHCVDSPVDDVASKLNREFAKVSLSLIAEDQDGVSFVDFLGQHVRQLYPSESDYCETVKKGYEFVKREHKRFAAARDHKLALRYAWLRQYYESRIQQGNA
ncbi:MAG: hypothetical protein IH986_06065 [Planctomycetes bacterium]|nr:hypothetical protein [Planctomycetota bacterium]